MTQILNNMKRKEKKGLFYLIGIAIMVAIMGISCSAKATAPADFSDTEDFIEVPAPEVKPSVPGQTPTVPTFPQINNFDTGKQFIGMRFKEFNGDKTITIVHPGNEGGGFELDGKKYRINSNYFKKDGNGEYTHEFNLVNETDNKNNGTALFSEDGSLKIWFGGENARTFIYIGK